MHDSISLTQFLIEEQRRVPGATGDFTLLINDVARACKEIASGVRRGALAGVLGSAGVENVQGEVQKQLDLIANDALIGAVNWTGHLAGMASEELEEIYQIPEPHPRGKYLLVFDPLDGSSNTEVNVSVGTIFSVLHAPQAEAVPGPADFLQPGWRQVCAGYAIYGPSTMLVLTMGSGVHGFTLDPGVGEFLLTHPAMAIAETTSEFAINMSNRRLWESPVRAYVDECLAGVEGPRGRDFNMRWIASMVAEVHRILTRGGVFMYPRDSRREGRLRLLYEANPMSFIVEQAGGLATTGRERILDLHPRDVHQRVPVILGSREEVARVQALHAEADRAA